MSIIERFRQSKIFKLASGLLYSVHNMKAAFSPIPEDSDRDDRDTVFIMIHALSGGGAEKVASIVASGLADRYHVVAVCLTRKTNEYPVDGRVKKIYAPEFKGPSRMVVPYRRIYIKRLKKRRDPALSISFLYSMNRYNVPTKHNDVVVCCERNNPFKNEAHIINKIRKLYENADHVIFQTETVRSLFSEEIRAHSTILRNPVSVECVRDKNTEHRIINIGRLTEQKNQKMLIRAFSEFSGNYPQYTLSIYGDGKIREELGSLILSLGMQDRIFLHGRIPNVHEAVKNGEIFVLSSDFEGMPNALLEAMMMGFPCISTACEGAKDIIVTGENGILTSVGNKEELLNAMITLAEDDNLRKKLSANAIATAELFKKDRITEQWIELADRLISKKSSEK